jgi:hypothetical protein
MLLHVFGKEYYVIICVGLGENKLNCDKNINIDTEFVWACVLYDM